MGYFAKGQIECQVNSLSACSVIAAITKFAGALLTEPLVGETAVNSDRRYNLSGVCLLIRNEEAAFNMAKPSLFSQGKVSDFF